MHVLQTFSTQTLIDPVCELHRGNTRATPARQEASRAATGPAAGRDATAKPTAAASQPATQPSRPAAQTATQPAAKLDEKLFTLGNSSKLSWCPCAALTHNTCHTRLYVSLTAVGATSMFPGSSNMPEQLSCNCVSRLIPAATALQMTCLQRMVAAPQHLRVWQISKTETLVRVQAKAALGFYHTIATFDNILPQLL